MDWQALRKFFIGEHVPVKQGKTFSPPIGQQQPISPICADWLLKDKQGNVAPKPLLRVVFVKVPKKEKGGT